MRPISERSSGSRCRQQARVQACERPARSLRGAGRHAWDCKGARGTFTSRHSFSPVKRTADETAGFRPGTACVLCDTKDREYLSHQELSGTRHPPRRCPAGTRPSPVPDRHVVLGTPLLPPFPEGVEYILLGMGCFWGAERLFWQLPGVYTTAVGYAGGSTPNATYREVCSGRTGHAEVVLVAFRPAELPLAELLRTFWEEHDPTQGMRQGNDVGTQYRSAIYYTTPEQREIVLALARRLPGGARREPPRADHDRDRRGRPVLPGRGVPPAVPAEEPERLLRSRRHGRLLPDRRRRAGRSG